MSPVSKKRKKKASPKPTNRARPGPPTARSARAELESVCIGLEEALRWNLRGEDPFEAELLISELLGSMRGVDAGNPGVPARTVEGFIDALAMRENPAATAALVALSRLAPGEGSRARALERLEEMAALGLIGPTWADALDAWAPTRAAEVFADDFGDTAIVSIEFAGAGRPHMLLADLDFSHLGGWCPAISFIDGAKDIETMRAGMAKIGAGSPGNRIVELDLAAARFLLERALEATARTYEPELEESFDDAHALALARLRVLPASSPGAASAAVRAALTAAGLHTPSPLDDRTLIGEGERDAVVRRFLASPPAAALGGFEPESVELLARALVDFGSDLDDGRPLRVSPTKLAGFLLRWLPRKVVLDEADKAAVPSVVGAWADFAAGEVHLPPGAVAALHEALAKLLEDFEAEYDNPENFGPARALLDGIGEVSSAEELERILAGRVAEYNASLDAEIGATDAGTATTFPPMSVR